MTVADAYAPQQVARHSWQEQRRNGDVLAMLDWIKDNQALLWWLSASSVVVLIASFFLIPFVIARIRPDYFAHDKRPDRKWINLHPAVRIAIHIGKNLLGIILLLAGLGMLALPGPGLITILVGFFLLDLPGKYRFEKWLVARGVIHRPINWLRRRSGRQPLIFMTTTASHT